MSMVVAQENAVAMGLDRQKLDLLKETICKGATDQEFQLFVNICQRTGLDPFMKQVFPVKRWDSKLGRESMTVQTSIDGYRLIAERSGNYVPGNEPTFTYDKDGNLISATAYVKKRTSDGIWHEISASAFYDEYCQRDKQGNPTQFWKKMRHTMLAKCAEALCLRKAFPADLHQLYTQEEMEQAQVVQVSPAASNGITQEQAFELHALLGQCDPAYRDEVLAGLRKMKFDCLEALTPVMYDRVKKAAEKKKAEYQGNKDNVVQDTELEDEEGLQA
jgi:phage recombination protein Bet